MYAYHPNNHQQHDQELSHRNHIRLLYYRNVLDLQRLIPWYPDR